MPPKNASNITITAAGAEGDTTPIKVNIHQHLRQVLHEALKELYGSWAPIPQLPSGTVAPGSDPPVAQVKLWLWSKTPFDYSRHGGRAWDEWFTDEYDDYLFIAPHFPRHDKTVSRLNAAEAFEKFLATKYVGQKRFGLEGAEGVQNPAAVALEWGVRRLGEKLQLRTRAGIAKSVTVDFFPAYDEDGGLLVALAPR